MDPSTFSKARRVCSPSDHTPAAAVEGMRGATYLGPPRPSHATSSLSPAPLPAYAYLQTYGVLHHPPHYAVEAQTTIPCQPFVKPPVHDPIYRAPGGVTHSHHSHGMHVPSGLCPTHAQPSSDHSTAECAAVHTDRGPFWSYGAAPAAPAPSGTSAPQAMPGGISTHGPLGSGDCKSVHPWPPPAVQESLGSGACMAAKTAPLEQPPAAPWPVTGPAFCHVAQHTQPVATPTAASCMSPGERMPQGNGAVVHGHPEPLVHNDRTAVCAHSVHEAVQDLMRALGESLMGSAPAASVPAPAASVAVPAPSVPVLSGGAPHSRDSTALKPCEAPVPQGAHAHEEACTLQQNASAERAAAPHASAHAVVSTSSQQRSLSPSEHHPPAFVSPPEQQRRFLSVKDLVSAEAPQTGALSTTKRAVAHSATRHGWNDSSRVSPPPKPPRLKDRLPRLPVRPLKATSAAELVKERRLVGQGQGRGRGRARREGLSRGDSADPYRQQREAAAASLEALLAREAKENVRPGAHLIGLGVRSQSHWVVFIC